MEKIVMNVKRGGIVICFVGGVILGIFGMLTRAVSMGGVKIQ